MNDLTKLRLSDSWKKTYVKSATKIGAEFIIIVALETEVMLILQCHKIKSMVNPAEASAVNKIVFLFFTLKNNFLLKQKLKIIKNGKANNIL